MTVTLDLFIQGHKLKFLTSKNGFPPSTASLLLANNFKIKKGEMVCDIGTGCGIQAIVAAKLCAKKVYASEINPYDCDVAIKNLELNKVKEIISVYHGNLLEPFTGLRFNVIITNLPQTPGKILKSSPKFLGYYGGVNGTYFIRRIIKKLPRYLEKNGRFYFQWGQISNPKRVEQELRKSFNFKKIAVKSVPFGTFELKIINKLLIMQKNKEAIFYSKEAVFHYDKIIYECKLK